MCHKIKFYFNEHNVDNSNIMEEICYIECFEEMITEFVWNVYKNRYKCCEMSVKLAHLRSMKEQNYIDISKFDMVYS